MRFSGLNRKAYILSALLQARRWDPVAAPKMLIWKASLSQMASSIRRQIWGRFWQSAPPRHISWQLVWEKKHISTPMQYCSLSSFIWKMANATNFLISKTLLGNIKSFELSLMLPSLTSIIRKLDFYLNCSGSCNTLRLPACCMNQDIHNLVTQTSNDQRKTILCKI